MNVCREKEQQKPCEKLAQGEDLKLENIDEVRKRKDERETL